MPKSPGHLRATYGRKWYGCSWRGFSAYQLRFSHSHSSELITVLSRKESNVYLAPAGNVEHSEKLTDGTGVDGNNVSWTTDGRILYDSRRDNLDVWVVSTDGDKQRLTSDSRSDLDLTCGTLQI